jgi:hypothetical protein
VSSTPPRLGPWLRRYDKKPPTSWRDRVAPILIGTAATLVFGLVLFGVLVAFTRFPLATVGGLLIVWIVGFGLSLALRRRGEGGRPGGPRLG